MERNTLNGYVLTDWDLIVATLHPFGVCANTLDRLVERRARVAADGYGRKTLDELCALDILFDWSHVRDSTPEARASVAYEIRLGLTGYRLMMIRDAIAANGGKATVER